MIHAHPRNRQEGVSDSEELARDRTLYLAENFRLDDTRIKTIGAGKTEQATDSKIRIVVYPVGSTAPTSQNQSH